MNKDRSNLVHSLIKNLASSHNHVSYSNLCQIREKIIINDEGIKLFCVSGGFPALVALLGRPNPKILNVVLSILGNCSRHAEYSKKVGELRVFEPLVKIIQNVSKDSVLSRACRLLGNLSSNETNAIALHHFGAVWNIVSLLEMHVNTGAESPLSLGTVSMAVRALGMLWIAEPCREDILSVNGVKLTVNILINHYSNKNNDIKHEFINSVLKVLLIFTARMNISQPSIRYVSQINDSGNDGYKCLVGLFAKEILNDDNNINITPMVEKTETTGAISEMAIANSDMALRIICRLSLIAECRTLLIKADALDYLIDRVENTKALDCLIKLCGDQINCTRVARTTALETLITVAKDTNSITKLYEILNIFLLYIEHKTTLMKLVNCGLIAILLKVINMHVDLNGNQHKPVPLSNKLKRKKKKRAAKVGTLKEPSSKVKRLNGISQDDVDIWQISNVLVGLANSNRPPSGGSNSESYSSRSPSWNSEHQSEDNEDCDDDYSPICSDSEEDALTGQGNTTETPLSDGEVNSDTGLASAVVSYSFQGEIGYQIYDCEDEEPIRSKPQNYTIEDVHTVAYIALLLLEQIASSKQLLPDLARSDTMLCLIRYLSATNQPLRRTTQILTGIIGRLEYLRMILHTEFAYELFYLRDSFRHEFCSHCHRVQRSSGNLLYKLTTAAESDCGVGEIENVLLTGSDDSKEKFIMLVPRLINNASILKKIMNKCSGVKTLVALISQNNHQKQRLVTALFKYANKTKKRPVYNYYIDGIPYEELNKEKDAQFREDDLTVFRLDDGTIVNFSKNLLCEASDVFNIMLTKTAFIESNSNEIKLKEFSEEGLRYFLYLVKNNHSMDNERFPIPNGIHTAVEALLLADKYLILDLKEKLANAIRQFMVHIDNIFECYELATNVKLDYLRLQCISVIFFSHKTEKEHYNLFESFEKSNMKSVFYSDIISYLTC